MLLWRCNKEYSPKEKSLGGRITRNLPVRIISLLLPVPRGKLSEATEVLREAFHLREEHDGKANLEILTGITRFADVVRIQGGFQEAIQLYEQTLFLYKKSLGEGDPTT